ncbi:MAG: hypothetical protein HRU39_01805 [Salinicola sp.]|nr:hypothetical protein [Salinicola sp.]
MAQNANLQLEWRATDRPVDLIAEGIDCAVRFGPLQDSALVVQRLGQVNVVNCASREYLARHGVPQTLDQLLTQAHRLVGYAASETSTSDARTFDYRRASKTPNSWPCLRLNYGARASIGAKPHERLIKVNMQTPWNGKEC